eukprot:g28178.t1
MRCWQWGFVSRDVETLLLILCPRSESNGPIAVSITTPTEEIASRFTDSEIGGLGSSVHSKPVSINLRRANGSAFVMKSLREPMVVVMKLTGQEGNATCAYWDEDEHRWSREGITASGLEKEILKALSSAAGDAGANRSRGRSYRASSDVTRRPTAQQMRQNSRAWNVMTRLQDLPELETFVSDFDIVAHKRRVAEDFLDAPLSIRAVQMFLATHEWLAVQRFTLFTEKHVRISFIFFKLLAAAAVSALALAGVPELPEDCPEPTTAFTTARFSIIGVGAAFVADILRYCLVRVRKQHKIIGWAVWAILALWALFSCLMYLASDGDQWLQSLGASAVQDSATRATMALKNPEVMMVVVQNWIEDEDVEAPGGREPEALWKMASAIKRPQCLPRRPANSNKKESLALLWTRGGTGWPNEELLTSKLSTQPSRKEEAGQKPKTLQQLPSAARMNKQADRSSAYHEAYKKAIQEGSDQEEAKEKAIAAFHRAGSDELSLPVDVPGLVEDSSSGDAKKPDLARKGEMYRIAYEKLGP